MALTRVTKTGNITVDGDIGIGVVPGEWSVNYPAFQIGQGGTFTGHRNNTQTQLGQNWWVGTGNQYVVNGAASRMIMNPDSTIIFSQAPSGTAGATMSTTHNRLVINTSGHVTTPNQPSFYVKDLAFSSGANSAGTTGTVLHNIGSHYSTGSGRFTVPVAGTYVFYGSVQMFNSGTSTYVDVTFYKNGTQYGIEFVSGKVQSGGHYNDHHTQEGMVIMYCNASDYVNIRATRGARSGTQSVFGGYLIG
jgi:hypothetical protein